MMTGLAEERGGIEANLLRTLIDTLSDLVWLKDSKGVFLACNTRFERYFGATEQEVVGKTDYDFVDRKLADSFREHDRLVMAANKSMVNEEWVTFADDGHRELLETVKTPMHDRNGKLIGLLSVARNITERKQSQRQMDLLELAMKASFDAVFLLDKDSRIRYANDAACRSLGYSREELLTMGPTDFDLNATSENMNEVVQSALSGGATIFETVHRAKDGQLFPVEISASLAEHENELMGVAVVRNITERKRAEEKMRITASVFNASQEAIVITDADNAIIDVNPAFTRITGYNREEVLGRNPNLLRSDRQSREFYKAMWQSLRNHRSWRGEIWNRRKTGEIYPEMLSINTIYDEHGKVQHHVGIFSDISRAKQYEAELSRAAHYDALTDIPNRVLLTFNVDVAKLPPGCLDYVIAHELVHLRIPNHSPPIGGCLVV